MEREKLIEFGCNVSFDKSGKDVTSFKSGGRIKCFLTPQSEESLEKTLRFLKERGEKYALIGNGSNVLIADKGYDGYLISTQRLTRYAFIGTRLYAEAGCNLAFLSAQSVKNSLSGLEFAAGIPASVGGGLYMNCGAFGGQLSDVVVEVAALVEGKRKTLTRGELEFDYRKSIAQKREVVFLSAVFQLNASDMGSGIKKREEYIEKRKKMQPQLPSAGSVFRRAGGESAGKLVEQAGLKGRLAGGAQISELHANFIVNLGGASTEDYLTLMRLMKDAVKEKYGIELKEEVEYIE